MNRISRILYLLLFAPLFIGCSSDSDGEEAQISEEQLNAIVGSWTLVELNVMPAQDVNADGTASENLLQELPCMAGTLVFTEEFRWSRAEVQLNVSQITGGAFGISCGTTTNESGDWLFLNNQILLEDGTDGTLQLSGSTMTRTIGEDLPGIRQFVYQKQ